jgi:hypothetical protein
MTCPDLLEATTGLREPKDELTVPAYGIQAVPDTLETAARTGSDDSEFERLFRTRR